METKEQIDARIAELQLLVTFVVDDIGSGSHEIDLITRHLYQRLVILGKLRLKAPKPLPVQ